MFIRFHDLLREITFSIRDPMKMKRILWLGLVNHPHGVTACPVRVGTFDIMPFSENKARENFV